LGTDPDRRAAVCKKHCVKPNGPAHKRVTTSDFPEALMKTQRRFLLAAACVLVSSIGAGSSASASTIPVDIAAFGPGSTLTTFAALANGTEVNGLTVDGILFQYSLGNGSVIIDGGPGITNNITPPNIVSIG